MCSIIFRYYSTKKARYERAFFFHHLGEKQTTTIGVLAKLEVNWVEESPTALLLDTSRCQISALAKTISYLFSNVFFTILL